VDVAEQPARAGGRVRAQPRADIGRKHDPAIGRRGQRQPGQIHPQPADLNPAAVKPVIERAVTPPVLRRQRQPGQGPDLPVRAEHRVGQLEQRVAPRGQALIQISPETG
jgi:hypothetical protein